MSAPLTLAEVRKAPERELLCWDDVNNLVATIEWLVERLERDVKPPASGPLSEWLRGEA